MKQYIKEIYQKGIKLFVILAILLNCNSCLLAYWLGYNSEASSNETSKNSSSSTSTSTASTTNNNVQIIQSRPAPFQHINSEDWMTVNLANCQWNAEPSLRVDSYLPACFMAQNDNAVLENGYVDIQYASFDLSNILSSSIPTRISFDVTSSRSLRYNSYLTYRRTTNGETQTITYNGNQLFWTVQIRYLNKNNEKKYYAMNFADEKYRNAKNACTTICWDNNGNKSEWKPISKTVYNETYYLEINKQGVLILTVPGIDFARTFTDFSKLLGVDLHLGTATELRATDLTIQQMSDKGIDNIIDEVFKKEDFYSTIRWTNILLKHQPHYGFRYGTRAFAYDGIGEKQKAIEDFTSAIKYLPENSEEARQMCYYMRGMIKHELGDMENAIIDLQRGGTNGESYLIEHNLPFQKKSTNQNSSSNSTIQLPAQKKPTLTK